MAVVLNRPDVAGLERVLGALREWQRDGAPVPLHPGDVGWFWRFGGDATAAAVRTWSRGDRIVALGLLDGPNLLRMAIAPEADHDDDLAERVVADLADPARGVFLVDGAMPANGVSAEVRSGVALREGLIAAGWVPGEPWTPLVRDLTVPMNEVGSRGVSGLRVEVAGRDQVEERCAVHAAAFERSTLTSARWQRMASGPAYADARCLVGYDEAGEAVAAATVWSAGPGRPGLLEPMGVHREHRGRGYGTAITAAAADALRELGSSTATVCTPSVNAGGIATYRAAGFRALPEVADLCRDAPPS
jgi:GNAT superfamily N-acetyltransferase